MRKTILATTLALAGMSSGVCGAQALVPCKSAMLVTSVATTHTGSRYEYTYTLRNFSKTKLTMYVFNNNFPAGFTVDVKQRSGVKVDANGASLTLKLGSAPDQSVNPGSVERLYDTYKGSGGPYISLMNCQVAQ